MKPTPDRVPQHTKQRSRGQSIVEFALIAPVLFFLLLGVLEACLLMITVGSARYAAAEGAREASQLGNAADTDSMAVQVIRNSPLGQMSLASVTHIDIYRLNLSPSGQLVVDSTAYNSYRLDGTPASSITWPPSSRDVKNGESDFLGVSIYYQYTWKTGTLLSHDPLQLSQSFDVRLEPQTY